MAAKRPSSGGKWKQLFPTKCSLFVFLAYMALFINQGTGWGDAKRKTHFSYTYMSFILSVFV